MADLKERLEEAKGRLRGFKKGAERGMRVLVGTGLGAATGAAMAAAYVYTDQTNDQGEKIVPEVMGVPAPVLATVLSASVAVMSKSESMQTNFASVATASAAIASQDFFREKMQAWKDDKDSGGSNRAKDKASNMVDATNEVMRRLSGKASGYQTPTGVHPASQEIQVQRG